MKQKLIYLKVARDSSTITIGDFNNFLLIINNLWKIINNIKIFEKQATNFTYSTFIEHTIPNSENTHYLKFLWDLYQDVAYSEILKNLSTFKNIKII